MGFAKNEQVTVAAYVVFPAFIFDQVYSQTKSLRTYYMTEGSTAIEKYKMVNITAIFWLMVYAFCLMYEQRKFTGGRITSMISKKMDTFNDKDKKKQKKVDLNMHILFMLIQPLFRYLALIQAIGAGLITINIPNSLLILFSLYLIKGSENDRQFWKWFFYLQLFLIINLYLARFANGFITALNVEWISLLGMYANNNTQCNPF